MKLSKNETAVFKIKDMYGNYSEKIYFFGETAANLRKNSRNLTFWNGNSYITHSIKFHSVEKFDPIDESPAGAVNNFKKIKVDDEIITIYSTNISGRQTPFMA